jgi:tetraacyldisaccharide 4'-kinase
MMSVLRSAGAAVYGSLWEARRDLYARGMLAPRRVPARVVSVGNLTVGGTGKTTLVLDLARRAAARGVACAVACRRYRPGPSGLGDEELMYRAALGEHFVHAGSSKLKSAAAAAAAGASLVLVDDGFQHWALARDADLVLVDARDPWGGGHLLPAGRLREPRRAIQRADALIVTRLRPAEDPGPLLAAVGRYAPAAVRAAARHRVLGARDAGGAPLPAGTRVRVVTATGNPGAVEESAREAGLEVTALAAYRDHHAFAPAEAAVELKRAAGDRARVLITAKDHVRWPEAHRAEAAVLEVEWEWVAGGDDVIRLVLEGR